MCGEAWQPAGPLSQPQRQGGGALLSVVESKALGGSHCHKAALQDGDTEPHSNTAFIPPLRHGLCKRGKRGGSGIPLPVICLILNFTVHCSCRQYTKICVFIYHRVKLLSVSETHQQFQRLPAQHLVWYSLVFMCKMMAFTFRVCHEKQGKLLFWSALSISVHRTTGVGPVDVTKRMKGLDPLSMRRGCGSQTCSVWRR